MMTDLGLLGSRLPIVAAPMAGGATTVALAAAVAGAGGFSFLAGGYKTVDVLAEQVETLRKQDEQFGVNLFVPSGRQISAEAFAAWSDELRPDFERYGLTPAARPVHDDDHWHDKLVVLRERPVPVVSFTFGLPAPSDIVALQRSGSRVLATVTTVAEAQATEGAGVDGLVVQGPAAGGHSATFDPDRPITDSPTADVVRAVLAVTDLPVIATGGIDGPAAVRELLATGAEAAAIGTLLLRTTESGASSMHKSALASPEYAATTITRAFTGRPARGLRTPFVDRHPDAPAGYPELHHLTAPLRSAAAAAGHPDDVHLWAGTGYRSAPEGSAADLVAVLERRL